MFSADLSQCTVKCYGYRTARVFGARLTFDRSDIHMVKLENALADMAGVSKDNHVVYSIADEMSSLMLLPCMFGAPIITSLSGQRLLKKAGESHECERKI